METTRRLIQLLRPHRRRLAIAAFCALVTCVGVLLFPLAAKALVGQVIAQRRLEVLPRAWLALGAGALALAASCYCATFLFFDVSRRVAASLRARYLEHLLSVPIEVHRQQHGGDLLDRLAVSVGDIESYLRYNLMNAATVLTLMVGGPVMMFYLSWKLSLLVLFVAGGAALVLVLLSRRMRHADRACAAATGSLTVRLQELLLGVDVVQAFNAQRHEFERFKQLQDRLRTVQRRATHYAALLEPLIVALTTVAFVVLLLFGSRWLASGGLTVDTLVVFLVYVAIAASQGRPLSTQFLLWHRLTSALQRLDETLALPRETDSPGARALPRTVRGAIEWAGVSYTYPNREQVLSELSFRIEPGECVGIVGESGAGKTTLFNLLLRFAEPQRGTICIDGIDLRHVTAASLRAAIAIVPQDSYLFNVSILENVRYGCSSATDAEVRAACREAQAEAFIAALPKGYETIVGERGLQLSAGQRQRLAIARALLRDTPILLLDEPTSALDAATERELRMAMETAVLGRTTLIIAHRLATVVHLPRLLVIHQGQLIADGSHEELLERCPHYRNLVSTQLLSMPDLALPLSSVGGDRNT